jgi:hypothetical protein
MGFFEIDGDGYCVRYLEIHSDGDALRYTEQYAADQFGVLPEKTWDEAAMADPDLGILRPISKALFDSAWHATQCCNDRSSG